MYRTLLAVVCVVAGLWVRGERIKQCAPMAPPKQSDAAPFVPRPPDALIPYISEGGAYQRAYDDYYESLDSSKKGVVR